MSLALMPPERVVAIARSWIGTPYRHQASLQHAGTDCLGLLRGIWRTLYGSEPEVVPPYSQDWAEPQGDEVLLRAALRYLEPQERALSAGDVLLFRMRAGSIAKHLGVCSRAGEESMFIHAYSGHAVTESPLSPPWQRKIAARFCFPLGV
ncbi:NlpC/P60 family protein [Planktotalea sp.]|uniref:NlpC/P60 family protein n=1 Tax=Planktotalea sp. TaxID=2029877 RepID=UPI003D6B0299